MPGPWGGVALLAVLTAGQAGAGGGGQPPKARAAALRLCAEFSLFPDNFRLPANFNLAGYTFSGPALFVNVTAGGKGVQFTKKGMKATLPAPVARVECKLGTFAGPVQVDALDAAGKVIQTRKVSGTNKYQVVTVSVPAPQRIVALTFTGGATRGSSPKFV